MSAGHRADYRADIDGLRAIAVLAVLGFHAFPTAVSGGFAGVDIFFVISGYLISGILFAEADQQRVDLIDFYIRRVRRIFPALTLVLVAVAVLGWLILTNSDYRQLQAQIAAGSVFLSNFVLWRESGYFDAPARFKPLLHLWSLGIEEQFYLLWPPIVYWCAARKAHAGRVAAVLLAASFLLNGAMVFLWPAATFYLPMTRMWELLLGAVIAYPQGISRQRIVAGGSANAAAWTGIGLIGVATFAMTSRLAYPGWWALLPTIGTALLVVAGAGAWVNRTILARRPLVAIGLISYPLYLWHWPLLSFLQIAEGGAPSARLKLEALALAVVLATLTFHLVERPIRRSLGRRTPFGIAVVAASLLLAGGVSLYARHTDLFAPKTPNLMVGIYSTAAAPRSDPACRARFPRESEYCREYATGAVTTALIGDSHAEHFFEGVGRYFADRGENVVLLGHSSCPPLIDLQRFTSNAADTFGGGVLDVCRPSNNAAIAAVAADSGIRRVILSFNGAKPINGSRVEGAAETIVLAGTLLSVEDSLREALERTVRRFVSANKVVWMILQVPELRFSPTDCFWRPFGRPLRSPCAVARATAAARQVEYRAIVEEVRTRVPELHVFDPWPYVCDGQWCYAVVNHDLLYVDDNHLSREGALFFAGKFHF